VNHIDKFEIGQFRGLRNLKIEGLSQINLLVGGNNSGKTSVLEALSIFCDPLNWRTWRNPNSARELLGGFSGVDSQVWLFPQGVVNKPSDCEIYLSASGKLSLKTVSAQYEEFTEIVRDLSTIVANGGIERKDAEYKEIEIRISTVETGSTINKTLRFSDNPFARYSDEQVSPALPAQLVTSFSHFLGGFQLLNWSEVVKNDQKPEVVELLKFFDSAIQDVDIVSLSLNHSLLSVKHKKLGRAPLSTFGDGLRRVFTLASVLPMVKNGLLLVDELEASIHTAALRKTIDWLIKASIQNNTQLFATTHSLETLDTIMDVTRDLTDITVFRLEKDNQGIRVTRFDKEMIIRLREVLGVEVR